MRIISTFLIDDGRILGKPCGPILERAQEHGMRVKSLHIQPLNSDWNSEPPGTFKSGAGPIFALAEAQQILEDEADLVLISGKDFLREYTSEERAQKMHVFPGITLPEAYTQLAEEFMDQRRISEQEFRQLALALEENYRRTARARGLPIKPGGEQPVTRLFRLLDCANPVTNFQGEVLLASANASDILGMTGPRVVDVATIEVEDGPGNIREIATYRHLRDVFLRVTETVDMAEIARKDQLLMEAYTCFPPVPLAFLECAGLARSTGEMVRYLDENPITLSGGMNFARAPWNNPALRGLILMAEALKTSHAYGLVHGNGGLGGRQAMALLASS